MLFPTPTVPILPSPIDERDPMGPGPGLVRLPPMTVPPIAPAPTIPFSDAGDLIFATGAPLADDIDDVGDEFAVPNAMC